MTIGTELSTWFKSLVTTVVNDEANVLRPAIAQFTQEIVAGQSKATIVAEGFSLLGTIVANQASIEADAIKSIATELGTLANDAISEIQAKLGTTAKT